MSRYILIDGGQGGCRIVYMADGQRVLTGDDAGLSRHARDRSASVFRVLEGAFADLGQRAPGSVVRELALFAMWGRYDPLGSGLSVTKPGATLRSRK
jgi:hypothetical protein